MHLSLSPFLCPLVLQSLLCSGSSCCPCHPLSFPPRICTGDPLSLCMGHQQGLQSLPTCMAILASDLTPALSEDISLVKSGQTDHTAQSKSKGTWGYTMTWQECPCAILNPVVHWCGDVACSSPTGAISNSSAELHNEKKYLSSTKTH